MVEQRTHKPRVPRSIRGTATIPRLACTAASITRGGCTTSSFLRLSRLPPYLAYPCWANGESFSGLLPFLAWRVSPFAASPCVLLWGEIATPGERAPSTLTRARIALRLVARTGSNSVDRTCATSSLAGAARHFVPRCRLSGLVSFDAAAHHTTR